MRIITSLIGVVFGGAAFPAQGLPLARQLLCHLNHAHSPWLMLCEIHNNTSKTLVQCLLVLNRTHLRTFVGGGGSK
jgi:hypothetical protein